MIGKRCFFIGHRDAMQDIVPALERTVEALITAHGVTEFFVGGYGGFDCLAAGAVIRAKRSHPHITLELLLPYHPSERPIEPPNGFDGTFYPPGMERVPRRLAILKANRYMVNHSDCIIAYIRHPGNARNLLEYARKRSIPVWEV